MKKSLILTILGLLVVTGIILITIFVPQKKSPVTLENNNPDQAPQSINLCYQYSKETSSGFTDKAILKMTISGKNFDQVTGEYKNLPAEKDSKVGTFKGTVGPMDPKISARTADVWWDSMAEGMPVTEQLRIQFGDGSAVALFGEMVERATDLNGVYVYKDPTKLTPGFQMEQIDCDGL